LSTDVTDPEPIPVAVFEEFLAPMELARLHAFVAARADDFAPSTVTGKDKIRRVDPRQRRSRVLFDLGPFEAIMRERLTHFLPHVFQRLRIEPFAVSRYELQMTVSGDGDYFRAHTDNSHLMGRALSFVYYGHAEPRAFEGGQLHIYGRDRRTGETLPDMRQIIEPVQNSLVAFRSHWTHEVTPIRCASPAPNAGRLTLNGWAHR